MARNKRPLDPDAPLRNLDHSRPVTRRDFLGRGLAAGAGVVAGASLFSLFANPREAFAALSGDISALKTSCGLATQGAKKIPFICFDLAGGANIAGSNVLVGKQGGQLDFLTTAGYSKLGIPGDMLPSLTNPATNTPFFNTELGLAFHSDSAFLRGILERTSTATRANVNGAAVPARSDNDTSNNPHNPMYGIYKAMYGASAPHGGVGELLTLIGSQSSDSGGNSMAPASMIDLRVRPTKVDRASDATGLVDTGKLVGLLNQADAVAVMESIERISANKLPRVDTLLADDAAVKDLVQCGYVKAADSVDRFGNPATLNPTIDANIVGGIFSSAEYNADAEFRKTAAIMKLVVNGFAGAGTITMGGFDYHTGDRSTGELRDLRAGRCIGACLEYAARVGVPLMIYVFSDGSLASNGMVDSTVDGRGKGVWTADNSDTAASFFLVYSPVRRATLMGADAIAQAQHQQIGWFSGDGSVVTSSKPTANNVNLLVQALVLNYLALHGEQGSFASLFPSHGLGSASLMDSVTAFTPICNGNITQLI